MSVSRRDFLKKTGMLVGAAAITPRLLVELAEAQAKADDKVLDFAPGREIYDGVTWEASGDFSNVSRYFDLSGTQLAGFSFGGTINNQPATIELQRAWRKKYRP